MTDAAMKNGAVVLAACAALGISALAVRHWRGAVAPETGAGVERGSRGSDRGALGRADSGSGRASAGGGSAPQPAGDRAPAGAPAESEHRSGSAPVVRGMERSAAGEAAAGAAGRSLGAGEVRLTDRAPEASRRDVPDMPKQTSQPLGGATEDGAAPAAAEPAPEFAYEGGADHVFSTKSQVQVQDAANITGDAGTVSFWLKPEWGPNSQDDATFVQFGDSGLQVVKNVNFLRFEYIDQNGTENGLGTSVDEWPNEQWRQVTATWTNGNLALYVDGQLISQNRFQLPPTFGSETHLLVGSNFVAPVAPGELSYLTVLNRDSSPTEVTHNFQSGQRPSN